MTKLQLSAIALVLLAFISILPGLSRANMAPPRDFTLGLAVERVAEGARIKAISKAGVADKAGLQVNDVVLGVDGRYAKKMTDEDLRSFAEDLHPWPFDIILAREDSVLTVRVSR